MRKWMGHALVGTGALVVVGGAFAAPVFVAHPGGGGLWAVDIDAGRTAIAVGFLSLFWTLVSAVLRRRSMLTGQGIAALILAGCVAWAKWGAAAEIGLPAGWSLHAAMGLWALGIGTILIAAGALESLLGRPVPTHGSRPLRLAVLWRSAVISERMLWEPATITLGTDNSADISLPDDPALGAIQAALGPKEVLLRGDRAGRYTLSLLPGMTGRVCVDGDTQPVKQLLKDDVPVPLGPDDYGIISIGPLALFFQHVNPEPLTGQPLWHRLDSNSLASSAISALVHVSVVLFALFAWEESEDLKRRFGVFQTWQASVVVDTESQPEEVEEPDAPDEDEGLSPEDSAKTMAFDGDAGKMGDPELAHLKSAPPKGEAKGIRPARLRRQRGIVGALNDTSNHRALAQVLSGRAQTAGNRIEVAMGNAGDGVLLAGGTNGLSLRGGKTGGGGTCTGADCGMWDMGDAGLGGPSGTGLRLKRLKPKTNRKVDRMIFKRGSTTKGCSKANISRTVRSRASSFRSCFERRLVSGLDRGGRLSAQWTIGMDGRVSSARIVQDSVRDAKLSACVLRALRNMRFARPEGGMCAVKWPFVFRSPGM